MQVQIENTELATALGAVVAAVHAEGGRSLLVGGCVRDALLDLPIRDLDVEVYGVASERLRDVVAAVMPIDLVGESFAVLRAKGLAMDVSLPRRESKRGSGHRGFLVEADPTMSPRDAACRRDFTINAMAFDPTSGELLDYFGGVRDLEGRVLRHVSDAFVDDPLRVLRGAQFAARFDAAMAPETVALCRTLGMEDLAAERVFEEFRKLVVLGRAPSKGLRVLEQTGWLAHFPELTALINCPQDPEWHPEGDVWIHTQHVVDFFAGERVGNEWEDLVVGFACLCHDLGKPATTEFKDERWRAHNHDEAGAAPTINFLRRMRAPGALIDEVVPLVRDHLAPALLHKADAGHNAVRRLANRVGRIDRLIRVARADHGGRPPKEWDGFPAGEWLLRMAADNDVSSAPPLPIVLGRHLIDTLGLEPGPAFGQILRACFDAQLEGEFTDLDGGLAFARVVIRDSTPSTSSRGSSSTGPTWIPVSKGALAVGPRPRKRGIRHLEATHVLTLLMESEGALEVQACVEENSVGWIWLSFDNRNLPSDEAVATTLEQVAQLLHNGGRVYVHCSAGIHRTGRVVYALLRHMGATGTEATATLGELRRLAVTGMHPDSADWGDHFARTAP
ncbi:MAG: hypothetical protein Q8K63_12460 [Acidimicrobiales bacterium]|nr:hypothetical protein [Acidimicrobiales bacterium]